MLIYSENKDPKKSPPSQLAWHFLFNNHFEESVMQAKNLVLLMAIAMPILVGAQFAFTNQQDTTIWTSLSGDNVQDITLAQKEYFRGRGDSLWLGLQYEDSLWRDLDYARLGLQLMPWSKSLTVKLLAKIDSGSMVAICISHEAEITTHCTLGREPGWGEFFDGYQPITTLSGWHTIKMIANRDYYSISLEFSTPGLMYYGYRVMPFAVTSIAVQRPDSTGWQEISGFIPPSNPYAEPAEMVNVTASFMQAVIDTSIRPSPLQGDTKVRYGLKSRCGLNHGDTLVIFGPGWNESDPDQVAKGIVQWAGGLGKDTTQPTDDWPLELVVVWPGDYNPKNLYRVRVWKINHQTNPTSVALAPDQPTEFSLGQNYPNPFNPTTTIPFSLDKPGEVRLAIYNLQGQLVRVLVNNQLPASQHQIIWDGRDDCGQPVPSGLYFCRLTAQNQSAVKKITLTK